MMRNIVAILLSISLTSLYSQTPREVLKNKLEFFYVANVNGTTAERLNNNAIAGGAFTGSFWTNSNMSGPQRMVKALLASPSQGGDTKLQRIASEIVRIRDESVRVYLLDDAASSITNATETNFGACDNGAGKSWPCARSYPDDNPMAGEMCLGTHFLSSYTPPGRNASNIKEYRYGTFVHELTHTQDNVEWRAHMHYDGQWYSYGTDGTHYFQEILPDLNATYKEAIANTFAMYYDPLSYSDGFDWFAQGGYMMVEHPPAGYTGPAITSVLAALQSSGVSPIAGPRNLKGGTYSFFRMQHIPLGLIMNNEILLAIMLESVRNYGGTDEYMEALKGSNQELFGVCANPVAVLFRNMCRVGLPSGVGDIGELNQSTGNAAYVFPLALADFFTGYQSQSKAQFREIFENQGYMDGWIDVYWDQHRTTVMHEAPLASGLGDLIVRIKEALGMI